MFNERSARNGRYNLESSGIRSREAHTFNLGSDFGLGAYIIRILQELHVTTALFVYNFFFFPLKFSPTNNPCTQIKTNMHKLSTVDHSTPFFRERERERVFYRDQYTCMYFHHVVCSHTPPFTCWDRNSRVSASYDCNSKNLFIQLLNCPMSESRKIIKLFVHFLDFCY